MGKKEVGVIKQLKPPTYFKSTVSVDLLQINIYNYKLL